MTIFETVFMHSYEIFFAALIFFIFCLKVREIDGDGLEDMWLAVGSAIAGLLWVVMSIIPYPIPFFIFAAPLFIPAILFNAQTEIENPYHE